MEKFLRYILIILIASFIFTCFVNSRSIGAENMEYNEFVTKIQNNEVSKVLIEKNQNRAFVYMKDSETYYEINLASFDEMQNLIFKAKENDELLDYTVANFEKPSFLISCIIILGISFCFNFIISVFVRTFKSVIKKSKQKEEDKASDSLEKKKMSPETESKFKELLEKIDDSENGFSINPKPIVNVQTRFTDVIGLENQLDELNDIVSFLKEPEVYKEMNAQIPKGILLYGPSGTGKTLIARAIAGEAEVSFFYASAAQLQSMYVGGSEKNIRKLFEVAKKNAPSIIFLDELDSIATQRYSENSSKYAASVLNQLLTCIDGFEESSGVIVIAATNSIEVLDSAILRRGRFDRHIYIPLPDKNARMKIVEYYLKNKYFDWKSAANNNPCEEIASMTTGFSGSDIKTLVNEAVILAVRAGRDWVLMNDVYEAYRKITVGVKNSRMENNEEEKKMTAVHEAGHAIVSRLLGKTPLEISIIPRNSDGGYNLFADKEKSYYSVEDIMKEVKISLGGRAAEKVFYGRVTSGASSDLKHASEILYKMYVVFGMNNCDEVSLVLTSNGEVNDTITKYSIPRMEQDLKKCYDDAVDLLRSNRQVLDALANKLCEQETLENSDIEYFFVEQGI